MSIKLKCVSCGNTRDIYSMYENETIEIVCNKCANKLKNVTNCKDDKHSYISNYLEAKISETQKDLEIRAQFYSENPIAEAVELGKCVAYNETLNMIKRCDCGEY